MFWELSGDTPDGEVVGAIADGPRRGRETAAVRAPAVGGAAPLPSEWSRAPSDHRLELCRLPQDPGAVGRLDPRVRSKLPVRCDSVRPSARLARRGGSPARRMPCQWPRFAFEISTGRAGAPSIGAGSSGVAAIPPAAIRSRVANPASSTVPKTVYRGRSALSDWTRKN